MLEDPQKRILAYVLSLHIVFALGWFLPYIFSSLNDGQPSKQTNPIVIHDNTNGVTCWLRGEMGISCIADKELTRDEWLSDVQKAR